MKETDAGNTESFSQIAWGNFDSTLSAFGAHDSTQDHRFTPTAHGPRESVKTIGPPLPKERRRRVAVQQTKLNLDVPQFSASLSRRHKFRGDEPRAAFRGRAEIATKLELAHFLFCRSTTSFSLAGSTQTKSSEDEGKQ
uniref:Uncharacterized protein n=1 Tax=Steinernema glaseri TaxID=37863 RepID=A0A1I7Y7W6_9BILA